MAQEKETMEFASMFQLVGIKPTTNKRGISTNRTSWRQWIFTVC